MDIHKIVPWWLKIILKVLLSRLKVSYSTWQKLKIFRHGLMDEPEYAFNTFLRHYESAGFAKKKKDFVVLELGPGDSVASGVIARCFGAKKSFLVDKGNDAVVSSKSYVPLFNYLNTKFDLKELKDNTGSIGDLVKKWDIEYLTDGLTSLKELPDQSIDYLWSQSVLEHIRKKDFAEYVKQFRRLISRDGVCVHGVDLKDHLSYAHNNLRFSEKVWESEFMANSGFYTNRILYTEMLNIFRENNFEVEVLNIKRWTDIPTSRHKLHPSFSNLTDDDLMIAEFDVILKPV